MSEGAWIQRTMGKKSQHFEFEEIDNVREGHVNP